jgi:HlyD family secretion protein
VTFNVTNSNGAIKPGMTANLNVAVAQRDNVLVVPLRAIHTQGNQKTVTVLYKGQAITTPIQTGLANDQSIEVTSGLQPGDRVVLNQTSTTQPNFRGGGFGGFRGLGG